MRRSDVRAESLTPPSAMSCRPPGMLTGARAYCGRSITAHACLAASVSDGLPTGSALAEVLWFTYQDVTLRVLAAGVEESLD
jgi:hypothetical protein